jgi:hypothetical protein
MITPNSISIHDYPTYAQRWFVVFVALFANMAAGLLWMPYSSVTDQAAEYFQVTEERIELFTTVVFGSCVLAGIPAMSVLDSKCLKIGVSV